jgi:hypothetical protein
MVLMKYCECRGPGSLSRRQRQIVTGSYGIITRQVTSRSRFSSVECLLIFAGGEAQ